jgi:hypothetical protein
MQIATKAEINRVLLVSIRLIYENSKAGVNGHVLHFVLRLSVEGKAQPEGLTG